MTVEITLGNGVRAHLDPDALEARFGWGPPPGTKVQIERSLVGGFEVTVSVEDRQETTLMGARLLDDLPAFVSWLRNQVERIMHHETGGPIVHPETDG